MHLHLFKQYEYARNLAEEHKRIQIQRLVSFNTQAYLGTQPTNMLLIFQVQVHLNSGDRILYVKVSTSDYIAAKLLGHPYSRARNNAQMKYKKRFYLAKNDRCMKKNNSARLSGCLVAFKGYTSCQYLIIFS